LAELKAVLTDHTIIGLDAISFVYLFERHPQSFPVAHFRDIAEQFLM